MYMEVLLKHSKQPMIVHLQDDVNEDDLLDNLRDLGGDWKRFIMIKNKQGATLVYNIDEIVSLSVVP